MPQLTSDMWVSAYLMRLRIAAIPAFLVCKGDATAGAVMVKLALMNGQAELWARRFDFMTDTRSWEQAMAGDEVEVDAFVTRERSRDPDIWVIEVEDPKGRTLLNEDGLTL